MYTNESVYNDFDPFANSGRIFNMNDPQNLWSSDRIFSNDHTFFPKNRSLFNTYQTSQVIDRQPRNRKPPGDRRETNLIVNYLPDGFFERELFELFSKAGPIAHHHVVRNKENRSECYGFVDYEKASDAEKAIEMFHQYPIQNKKLKVQNAAEGLQIKDEEKQRALKGFSNVGYNVEIKNAPFRWTVADVKNIFGKYGEIVKAYENTPDDLGNVDSSGEIKTKTFHIVYRYITIAQKVVRKKNKTPAEPLWPLELELSIIGQEFFEQPPDASRSGRSRSGKLKFDDASDSSWDAKLESQYYQKAAFENPVTYWNDTTDVSSHSCLPLSANGRPILKHKDNLMHLNSAIYDCPNSLITTNTESPERWSSSQVDSNFLFDNPVLSNKMYGSNKDIKAIWDSKDTMIKSTIPNPTDIFIRTPLVPSRFRLDDKPKYKANIWFKMENMQPTGSFKLRGIAYWCCKAKLDGVQHVVSSSGGNAGLAAAYACRLLNLDCTVVVPNTTPPNIIQELYKEKAVVVKEGSCWKEAHAKAESIKDSYPGICRILHPFDEPMLWSGYESIVDEIVADMRGSRIDLIVLAVGGGGLLNGISQGISKNKLNKTTAILALETEGTSCFHQSMAANELLSINPEGIATSLGSSKVSQKTWEVFTSRDFHLFSKTCSDAEAIDACYQFLHDQNCLVEPACGAALSSVYGGTLDQMAECRNCDLNVVLIVCGGRCVDVSSLLDMRQIFCERPYLNFVSNNNHNQSNSGTVSSRLALLDISKDHHYLPTTSSHSDYYHHPFVSEPQQQQQQPHPLSVCNIFNSSKVALSSSNNIHNDICCKVPSSSLSVSNVNNNSNGSSSLSVLSESKFGFQRNLNDNSLSTSNFNFHVVNTEQNNFVSTELIASPVGSQHSDKENRLLSTDN